MQQQQTVSPSTRYSVLRHLGFVTLNTGITLGGAYAIVQFVRAITEDGMQFFVQPLSVIAPCVFLLLYPILRRLPSGRPRFLALYGAFAATLFTLGLYSGILLSKSSSNPLTTGQYLQWMVLIVIAGHVYGSVWLVVIAAVNKLCSPLLFPRDPASAS